MNCPDCGSQTVGFVVPDDLQQLIPADERALALCTSCLTLHPTSDDDTTLEPEFAVVSDAFPTGEVGISMALAVGLLDSLALYRAEIETLLERVERAGTDPLLVLDRLAMDPALDPRADLRRRRGQVEQFRD